MGAFHDSFEGRGTRFSYNGCGGEGGLRKAFGETEKDCPQNLRPTSRVVSPDTGTPARLRVLMEFPDARFVQQFFCCEQRFVSGVGKIIFNAPISTQERLMHVS